MHGSWLSFSNGEIDADVSILSPEQLASILETGRDIQLHMQFLV